MEIGEWDDYFRKQLGIGGVENRVVRGMRRGIRDNVEDDIREEEIKIALGKFKSNKAVGIDEIPAEV